MSVCCRAGQLTIRAFYIFLVLLEHHGHLMDKDNDALATPMT